MMGRYSRRLAATAAALLVSGLATGSAGAVAAEGSSGDPVGQFDSLSADGDGLRLRGWAIDPDTAAPIYLWVTVDGVGRHVYAGELRSDVGRAHPDYGDRHGLDVTIPAGPGAHRVCVAASNVGRGKHASLGCRRASVPDGSPFGNVERLRGSSDAIELKGWAIDPDTTDSVYLWVTVDGVGQHVQANDSRGDVGSAFPGYGDEHGVRATIDASPGPRKVCVTAANVGPGGHRSLGCRRVVVGDLEGGSPVGNFERATLVDGGIEVKGWAVDPDTADSVYVWVTVDGDGQHLFANEERSDVGRAFPAYGDAHGFRGTIATQARYGRVCVTVANVGEGRARSLGCRDVGTRPQPAVAGAHMSGYEAELFRLTNASRAAHGLGALAPSGCASGQALIRARGLIGSAQLSHASLRPVMSACGPARVVAENLSRGVNASGSQVVNAWMASSGHRANILDGRMTHLGIECVADGSKTVCSQVFIGAR